MCDQEGGGGDKCMSLGALEKHGRPHKFLQVGTSLNYFKHERKKSPNPYEENGPQKEKKSRPH